MISSFKKLGRWYGIGCLIMAAALILAVLLPKCEGPGPHPFTRTAVTTAYQECTQAFGQCQVTIYRFHYRTMIVLWDCFAQPPVKPGVSDVWVAVNDCFRP